MEYCRLSELSYNNHSNRIMSTKSARLKSARIGQAIRENLNPGRYEKLNKELKEYFSGDHYADLIKVIDESSSLNENQFKDLTIQLMMITILSNGHRAEVGRLFRRKDCVR